MLTRYKSLSYPYFIIGGNEMKNLKEILELIIKIALLTCLYTAPIFIVGLVLRFLVVNK